MENIVAKFEGTYVQGGVKFPTRRAAQQAASEIVGNLGPERQIIRMSDYRGAPWYFKDSMKRTGAQTFDKTRGFRNDFMGHYFNDGTYIPPHINIWFDELLKLHFFY